MDARSRIAVVLLIIPMLAAATFGLTPSPADAGSSSYLAIDADPSDGCGTIQGSRFITTGQAVSVGVCLMTSGSPPASGLISDATLGITYISPLSASDVAGNGTTDLDANPDWAEASAGGAAAWDCNSLDNASTAPSAAPSPATITCASVGGVDRAISGDVLLATLSFDAPSGTGTSPLILDSIQLVIGGNQTVACNFGIICIGASIIVQPATATATNTPTSTSTPPSPSTSTNTPVPTSTSTSTNTPTPTNTSTHTPSPTPCTSGGTPVACPTASATRTSTRTSSPTATRTVTLTPTLAASATSPAVVGTQPSGGAGAGGDQPILLPDTGNHGVSTGDSPYAWLALSLGAAGALAVGMVLTVRHRRR